MNLKRYDYITDDFQAYEFYSEGPKGEIRKLVIFDRISDIEPPIYNLAFGDVHPETGTLDDKSISNNEDRDIILATVANTIIAFCEHYGNNYIYIEGSTASRTRLYQMGIAGLWYEISQDFDVFGLTEDRWQPFKPDGGNYEAFLVKRK